jgi:signal transduction histidine kinase
MNLTGDVFRDAEVGDLAKHLQRGDWCAVIAPRFSGKSTLARQLQESLYNEHPGWKIAYVGFGRVSTLDEAWEQVRVSLRSEDRRIKRRNGEFSLAEELASVVHALNQPACLLLDSVDGLPDQVLRSFASECRRLKTEFRFSDAVAGLRLVVFGAMELYYLSAGDLSPFTNVLHIIDFPDLTEEQTRDLFVVRTGCPGLSDEATGLLFKETAGHPHLASVVAREICRRDGRTEDIQSVAREWSASCALPDSPVDECFGDIIRYLESSQRAFDVVRRMLERSDPAPVPLGRVDGALLSGAICEREGVFQFRGRMIERALKQYMDSVRNADYCCLHGDWDKAIKYYEVARPKYIQVRRAQGRGASRWSIGDLFRGLVQYSVPFRQLAEAESFVVISAKHLFGADRALLWRLRGSGEAADLVAASELAQADESTAETASAAARNHAALTLLGNRGIVQGIGEDPTRLRWAIQLEYTNGLPTEWAPQNLLSVEPSLHAILSRAEDSEADENRHRQQQGLIHKVLLQLQRATRVNDVFALIVNGLTATLGYECALVAVVFPIENLLRGVESNGRFKLIQDLTVRDLRGHDVLARVIRSKEARIVENCSGSDADCDQQAVELANLKSQIILPLLVDNRALGTLQVADTSRTKAFGERDRALLQPFADAAAIAIQMATERESLELALKAIGNAMVVVDSSGNRVSQNDAYANLFNLRADDPVPLTRARASDTTPLVQLAFKRGHSLQTMREINGKRYVVTAASQQDSFGRYAGGVETIETRNPLYGLTSAIGRMIEVSDQTQLGQVIVDCLCQQFHYARARIYRTNPEGTSMVSSRCSGMSSASTRRFQAAEFRSVRDDTRGTGDGFECLRDGAPVIVMREQFAEQGLPTRRVVFDSQYRRVLVLPDQDLLYTEALDKQDVKEWMDVPLGTVSAPVGKLSIDMKGTGTRFGLEDLEVMSLYSRLAAEAMTRVLDLDRARRAAVVAADVRHLGERAGLESVVWSFLFHITMEGGPGLNRAAVFLRQPRAEGVTGIACHGAANSAEFTAACESGVEGSRIAFIDTLTARKLRGEMSESERDRIERFRAMTVTRDGHGNPFSEVLSNHKTKVVSSAAHELGFFYRLLDWEAPEECIICPLMFGGECEGLLYADNAFLIGGIGHREEHTIIESQAAHLAAAARTARLAEQLRHQVLGLSHTILAPMISIKGLADGLQESAPGPMRKYLELIIAESARGADTLRRMLYITKLSSGELLAAPQEVKICALLRERVFPYCALLEADDIQTSVDCGDPAATIHSDPLLIGSAFAEIAANAREALRTSQSASKFFRVSGFSENDGKNYVIAFENSGPVIPTELRPRIFDQGVSGTGGTGIGLSLVQEIIRLHGGRIIYEATERNTSKFTLYLPMQGT